jgi:tripartite ATP-independent transporter DctM subunit
VSDAAIGGASFGILLALMALRMPIGLAMFVVGAGGYILLNDVATLMAWLKSTPYYLFSNYTLSVVPLFILMGALAEWAGLSQALFAAADAVIGNRRGGMAMAAVGACTGFGAICGSSVATTATMGRAALPELRRFGYDEGLATGTLAVSGTLGILIPPSIILIIYAISTEQNISKLFMAALIPGLLAAALYIGVIAWLVRRNPAWGPAGPNMSPAERRAALFRVWPVLLIALTVVGGIYGGVFTPTEGASVGVVAMLILGIATRGLGVAAIADSLRQTAETTAMIFILLLGAEMFNAFLAISELPLAVSEAIVEAGLPPYGVLTALLLLYIVLGGVMDELAMLLLTLPVFFPVVMGLDFGMDSEETAIWFGILALVIVGIGLTAPPIGLNVFVMKAIAGRTPITTIYRGVLPFIASDLVRLILLILFPGLSLALVRLLS